MGVLFMGVILPDKPKPTWKFGILPTVFAVLGVVLFLHYTALACSRLSKVTFWGYPVQDIQSICQLSAGDALQ
jgi:hypothetical protein